MLGALMIGGRSSRMGFPKTMIPKGTSTLAAHLCNLLEEALGRSPVLVGEGVLAPSLDRLRTIPDLIPGAGPLSGLLALFRECPHQDFLVLATDLYAMNHDGLHWLRRQAEEHPEPCIRPRFADRPFGEPLAAVYRATVVPHLETAWQAGCRGPARAVPAHACFEPLIPDHLIDAFANVNRPDELDVLRSKDGSE